MKADKKALWLDALRSGDYKQTTGKLRTEAGYCCLGVLCEVAVNDGVVMNVRYNSERLRYDYDGDGYGLPVAVLEWAGLVLPDPYVFGEALSHWNDSEGRSFDEIAYMIEEEL